VFTSYPFLTPLSKLIGTRDSQRPAKDWAPVFCAVYHTLPLIRWLQQRVQCRLGTPFVHPKPTTLLLYPVGDCDVAEPLTTLSFSRMVASV